MSGRRAALVVAAALAAPSLALADGAPGCITFLYTTRDGTDIPYRAGNSQAFVDEVQSGPGCADFDLIEGDGELPSSCKYVIGAHVSRPGATNASPFAIEVESFSREEGRAIGTLRSQVGSGGLFAVGMGQYDKPFATAGRMVAESCARLQARIEKLRPAQTAAAAPAAPAIDEDRLRKIVQEAVEAKRTEPERKPSGPKSSVDMPRYHLGTAEHNLAVVIGIEKYSDIPEARYAERDAEAVKKHLLALGYPERNVITLIGQRATKSSLVKNLESWLANNAKPDSTVFVYFSGHGAPNPKSGEAYLVPWDGDPQFLEDTGYPVKRLYSKLATLPAKRVIVALDSCFSGAGGRSVLQKGVRPLVGKLDLGLSGSSKIVALTAAASDQISGVDDQEGHGLFTYFLLKGLNMGTTTVDGLYGYVTPNVQDEARRQNRDQRPQLIPASSAGVPLR